MSYITTDDGTEIFYKDWGNGQPIVFHHGWPLSSDEVAKAVLIAATPRSWPEPSRTRAVFRWRSSTGSAWEPVSIAPSSFSMSRPEPSTASIVREQPVSDGIIQNWWRQGMTGAVNAHYGIKAFSETDQTDDLKSIDVPTLLMHGDDDQVVPIADSSELAIKLLKHGTLTVYPGLPHGVCTTHADIINPDPVGLRQGLSDLAPGPPGVVVGDWAAVHTR